MVGVMHHIAGDGGSIAPLVRDLGVAYAVATPAKPRPGPELPVQYVDYALWQRAQFGELDDAAVPSPASSATGNGPGGMPERLILPTDRPYPPVADSRGATVLVEWPAELHDDARRQRALARPVSWWCRRRWRCCWARSDRRRMAVGFDRRAGRSRSG